LAWNVEFLDTAKRQLRKIDKTWQTAILDYLEDEIAPLQDPRSRGKALVGDKRGLWRYRVGDYRILCEIRDTELVITAVAIGHRREVSDRQRLQEK
jgi:mRNA interferase RelE/StbE